MEDEFLQIKIIYNTHLFQDSCEPFLNYINKNYIEICYQDEQDNQIVIGEGTFYLLWLEEAYHNDIDVYALLDQEEYVFRFFEQIFDFEEFLFVFNKENDEMDNCVFFENLKIINEFQGKGIFQQIIKHLEKLYFNRFPYIFLEAYPLQFSLTDMKIDNHFEKYHLKHKGIKKNQATKKLRDTYKKSGFKSTKINTNFMYKSLIETYEDNIYYINDDEKEVLISSPAKGKSFL